MLETSNSQVNETSHAAATEASHASAVPSTTQKTGMQAAVLLGQERTRVEDVALPQPGPHQVRVRLEGCGVCASNIPMWEGRDWFTYPTEAGESGHEGWGVIDAVGDAVKQYHGGERVALLSNHAYAEYDVADANAVICLPDSFAGQPFPAEPLGCAMNIFRRSQVRSGQTVAIVGIGFLGALLTQLATVTGARVIALSRRPFALEVARAMGAAQTIPLADHYQIIEQVEELTDGRFCEQVIEATGKQWPLDLAGELTCERGRLIIAGYHQDGLRQVNMQLWNWRGLDVINAHERNPSVYIEGMKQAVDAMQHGLLQPAQLYTHTFALNELSDALGATRERPAGFMKALIQF